MAPADPSIVPASDCVLSKRPLTSPLTEVPQATGTRVLIVEDNHDSRMALEKLLRLYGCDVSPIDPKELVRMLAKPK